MKLTKHFYGLYSAGAVGISPTYVVDDSELSMFKLKPWGITRRIQRMNKQLKKELGKRVTEKRAANGLQQVFHVCERRLDLEKAKSMPAKSPDCSGE